MSNPLRQHRSAVEWAAADQIIEIAEKINSFEGLTEIVASDLAALDSADVPKGWRETPVTGEIRFGFLDAKSRLAEVSGQISTTVWNVCQRCLEPFAMTLTVEPKLLLLDVDDNVVGFDEYEVWETEDDVVCPADVVEELLIMAMPFAAMHDNSKECKALASSDDGAMEMKKPFATLRQQMQQKN